MWKGCCIGWSEYGSLTMRILRSIAERERPSDIVVLGAGISVHEFPEYSLRSGRAVVVRHGVFPLDVWRFVLTMPAPMILRARHDRDERQYLVWSTLHLIAQ